MVRYKNNKKGAILQWIFAFAMIFAITIIWMIVSKPMEMIDNYASPRINITTNSGNTGSHVVNSVRNYWGFMPLIVIVFLILWAVFSSLKQDPNYPVM